MRAGARARLWGVGGHRAGTVVVCWVLWCPSPRGCWGHTGTGWDSHGWLTVPVPQAAPLSDQPQACHHQCCALPRAVGQEHLPPRPCSTLSWHGEQHLPRGSMCPGTPGQGEQPCLPVQCWAVARGRGPSLCQCSWVPWRVPPGSDCSSLQDDMRASQDSLPEKTVVKLGALPR